MRGTHQFLRMNAVINKIGFARSTIYDWMNEKSPRYNPKFPKPVRINSKSIVWVESELDAWLEEQMNSITY